MTHWRPMAAGGALVVLIFGYLIASHAVEPHPLDNDIVMSSGVRSNERVDGEMASLRRAFAVSATHRSVSETLAVAVGQVLDLLRRGLADRDELGFQAAPCETGDRVCLDALSLSFSFVLDTVVRPAFFTGELSTAWMVEAFGAEAVEATLVDALAEAADEQERIAVLAVMEQTAGLPGHELPAAAYADLRERSAAEVSLLFERHESTPVSHPSASSPRLRQTTRSTMRIDAWRSKRSAIRRPRPS